MASSDSSSIKGQSEILKGMIIALTVYFSGTKLIQLYSRAETDNIEKLETMLTANYRCLSRNGGYDQCPGLIEYYSFVATLDGEIFK